MLYIVPRGEVIKREISDARRKETSLFPPTGKVQIRSEKPKRKSYF